MVLKKGACMESFVPRTASASKGNVVPSNTVNAIPTSRTFCAKKIFSLHSTDSILCSDSRICIRLKSRPNPMTRMKPRKPKKPKELLRTYTFQSRRVSAPVNPSVNFEIVH